MSTITIDLDDELLAHVRAVAGESGMQVEAFVADLVATHAGPSEELSSEQTAAIEAGLAAIERGDVVPHKEVVARLDARYGG